jgi:hypothetical protein
VKSKEGRDWKSDMDIKNLNKKLGFPSVTHG